MPSTASIRRRTSRLRLASLDAISQAALIQWHRERYAPQDAILGIAGDVRAKNLIAKLEKQLAGWKKPKSAETWPRNPTAATERKVFLVDRPNSVQTTLALGNIAIDRLNPDYTSMVVMNHVIGGGASSRLFLNLREEKGYTYGVLQRFQRAQISGALARRRQPAYRSHPRRPHGIF
mgnify:CR=1 FL=1